MVEKCHCPKARTRRTPERAGSGHHPSSRCEIGRGSTVALPSKHCFARRQGKGTSASSTPHAVSAFRVPGPRRAAPCSSHSEGQATGVIGRSNLWSRTVAAMRRQEPTRYIHRRCRVVFTARQSDHIIIRRFLRVTRPWHDILRFLPRQSNRQRSIRGLIVSCRSWRQPAGGSLSAGRPPISQAEGRAYQGCERGSLKNNDA